MTSAFLHAVLIVALASVVGGCNSKNPAPVPDASTAETSQPAPPHNTAVPDAPPTHDRELPEPTAPAPDGSSNSSPVIDTSRYDGPPISVDIVQAKRLPPISTAMMEVTVPSGGWKLNLDKGEVVGDTARIFLTLERPSPEEWVTQALATHKQQFTSEQPPFFKVEVYVFLTERGLSTLTANYRLAASR